MTYIPCAKIAINGLHASQVRVAGKQVAVQLGIQLIERGAVTDGDVIDLVHGGRGALTPALSQRERKITHRGGQQVGLHHVGNKAKVAAGFTIAVDIDGLAFDHAGNPLGDDR